MQGEKYHSHWIIIRFSLQSYNIFLNYASFLTK